MDASIRPILVTGAHRSGTTWVGRMLAASPRIAYISEPLNVLHRPGVFRARVKNWYTYVCLENEAEYMPAFRDLLNFDYHLGAELRSLRSIRDLLRMSRDFGIFYLGSLRRQHPLLKDPFAVFSARWFAERLGCQIVVTVRHPAAFASSLKRLKWSFDFEHLLRQPLLMRDYLEPYRSEMESVEAADVVGQASLLWVIIYQTIHLARSQNPSIQIVLHEHLSLSPLVEYGRLYAALGLNFTAAAGRAILNSSAARNPAELSHDKMHSVRLDSRGNLQNWKHRLSSSEIARIRHRTGEVARLYYPEESWN